MPTESKFKHPLILALIGLLVVGFFWGYLKRYHQELLTQFGGSLTFSRKPARNFNPSALQWAAATSTVPWTARDAHALVAFDDKLWLLGGLNGNDFRRGKAVEYWKAPHFAEVWSSAGGANWQLITDEAPWGERRSAEAEVFKDKLWLIGGWVKNRGYRGDVWVSGDGLRWSEATSSLERWTGREGHGLAVFKDKMWLAGGVNFDERKTFNDVWRSDDGINWMPVVAEAPWPARYDHTLTVFQNKLWLAGGLELGGGSLGDVWVSEDGANWRRVIEKAPWPSRHGHAALVYKDRLWIIGGWNTDADTGLNDTWFSADGVNWQEVRAEAPWPGREDHAAAVFRNEIWLAGGMDKDWRWQNDVWILKP